MNNKVFIDLDKGEILPQLTAFQGIVDIKKNGKIIVKNSVLENIDILSEEELIYALKKLKSYISPIVTSQYIPRFKTEKPGTNQIIPISSREFFEGEKIFDEILSGIKPEWTELQKYKYLYNKSGQMLSYDLNTLTYTKYRNIHEQYSRNIFTAISKNWGLCASFAASYDYLCYRAGLESQVLSEEDHDYVAIEPTEMGDLLTDSTFDSVALKFGMKSKNFGISREKFIENDHNLEETEGADYEFEELSSEKIKQLDIEIGYLGDFGGEYTDEYIKSIGNNLEGKDYFEKAEMFLDRIKKIKYVGKPTAYDFETIIKIILSESEDKEFSEKVKVYNFISENTIELPRKIAIEVHDNDKVQYYIAKDGIKSFEKVDKIKEFQLQNEKE